MRNHVNASKGLGALIQDKLRHEGRTQQWLADQCGVTKAQINHIISGRSQPSMKTMSSIHQALVFDVKELAEALLSNRD